MSIDLPVCLSYQLVLSTKIIPRTNNAHCSPCMYGDMSILYNFRQTVLKDWFAQMIPTVDDQLLGGL